jgi:hypothetical protein
LLLNTGAPKIQAPSLLLSKFFSSTAESEPWLPEDEDSATNRSLCSSFLSISLFSQHLKQFAKNPGDDRGLDLSEANVSL